MKNKLVNQLLVGALVTAAITPLVGSVSASAADTNKKGWVYESNQEKWYYYNDNGEMLKNTTMNKNGQVSKFGEDGAWIPSEEEMAALEKQRAEDKAYRAKYPLTNKCSDDYKNSDDRWTNKDGNWYFNWKEFKDDEIIKDTWEEINGFWYHFDKDGVMEKNVTIKDECKNDCVLNEDGALTNRKEPEFDFKIDNAELKHEVYTKKIENGNEYYVNDKGEKKIGWVFDETDKKWHYTNVEGIAQKNTTITDNKGKTYKLDANGAWAL